MATIPLNSNFTNIYPDTLNTNYPCTSPSDETLTLLVAGISTPLLMVALAVAVITIMAIVWTKWRKFQTKHNQDTEQQEGSYAALIMGQVQQDGSYTTLTIQNQLNASPNHPTEGLYAIVDVPNQEKEGQMKLNIKHPSNLEER